MPELRLLMDTERGKILNVFEKGEELPRLTREDGYRIFVTLILPDEYPDEEHLFKVVTNQPRVWGYKPEQTVGLFANYKSALRKAIDLIGGSVFTPPIVEVRPITLDDDSAPRLTSLKCLSELNATDLKKIGFDV